MASFPPYAEQTLEFKALDQGMGLAVQRDQPIKQYFYDLYLDGSIAGVTGKGPLFHAQTGPAGQSWRDSTIGLDGNPATQATQVEREFGGIGRYVYIRQNDSAGGWVQSHDFDPAGTLGRVVSQMCRFRNHGSNPKDVVYVTTSDAQGQNGELWWYSGTAWTQVTNGVLDPAGATPFRPTAIERRGDELFAMGGAELRTALADPTDGTNWVNPVYVGDAGGTANWLRTLHGQVFCFKSEGLYSVSGTSGQLVVTDLFPEFRFRRSPNNGRGADVGRDALWFRWGEQLQKVTTTGDTDGIAERHTVGTGVLMDNQSPVTGMPIAMAWHGSWFGYFLMVSGSDTYLCKWGTWLNPAEDDPAGYRFSEVPNGAVYKWTGKTATHLWVSYVAGLQTNGRLYVGFANGSVEWCFLPYATPSPFSAGSGCEFTQIPGQRYLPKIDCDWPSLDKSWRAATLFGRNLGPSNPVRLFFLTEGQSAYSEISLVGSFTELDDRFTTSTQRIDFPNSLGSKLLSVYLQLENGTVTATPLVEALAIHYTTVPPFVLEYTGAVDARHFRARRDGTVDQRDPRIAREAVLKAIVKIGSTTTILPDGRQKELNWFRYTEELPAKWRRYGIENLLPFKAIDFNTTDVYGTYARLEPFTYGYLEQFIYQQLEKL